LNGQDYHIRRSMILTPSRAALPVGKTIVSQRSKV